MRTIEERAKDWATNKPQSHGRLQGYIKGATEQKAIDIEKACEWVIQNYLGDYIDSDGYFDNAKLANDILKAME